MKAKLLLGTVFLGVLVLAAGGFTVRRSRRALRVVLRGRVATQPAAGPVYA